MKTRTLSLPLVILTALVWGSSVSAQTMAHSPLFAYLAKMPESPAFPDDPTLQSTAPDVFEDHSDLNALQKNLDALVNGSLSMDNRLGSETKPALRQAFSEEGALRTNETLDMKRLTDTMMSGLKAVQEVQTEFRENFRILEVTYNRNIEKAYEASRVKQKEEPCGTNANCQREHARLLNSGVIAVTREKLKNEEYLLSVYLQRIKPGFKYVDDLLAGNDYGDGIRNKEVRDLFRSARNNQLQLLTDIIERIKIERITISNCARLAQQYQEK